MMTEPDVALTDYGLVVECGLFAYLIHRAAAPASPRGWFVLFFASVGLAALAGGTVHGFFLDPRTWGATILWPVTLLAIGVTALAAWGLGARVQFAPTVARWVTLAAAVEFVAYGLVVLFVSAAFVVAIVNYLPAIVFLLAVFTGVYRRTGERRVLLGLGALLAMLGASWIQQRGIAFHPVYFNHNALYHAIQALALFMLYRSARWFARAG